MTTQAPAGAVTTRELLATTLDESVYRNSREAVSRVLTSLQEEGGGSGGGSAILAPPAPLPESIREALADHLRRTLILRKTPPFAGTAAAGPLPPIRPYWLTSPTTVLEDLVAQCYRVDPASGEISLAVGLGRNLLLYYPPVGCDPESADPQAQAPQVWGRGLQAAVVPDRSRPATGTMLNHGFTFAPSSKRRAVHVSVAVAVPNPLDESSPDSDGVYVQGIVSLSARLLLYVGADWVQGASWKHHSREFFSCPDGHFEAPAWLDFEGEIAPGSNFVLVSVGAEAVAGAFTFTSPSDDCACLSLLGPADPARMTPVDVWGRSEVYDSELCHPVRNRGPIRVGEMALTLTELD